VPAKYVLDASIVGAAYLAETETESATEAIGRIEREGMEVHAPDLLLYEVANALLKRSRRGELSSADALTGLRKAATLPIDLHTPQEFVAPSLTLAAAYDLTAYDAAYLAVGIMLGAPLVTLDSRLKDRAEAAGLPAITARQFVES